MIQYMVINGTLLPKEEGTISPDDRGFRLGDGVFETIRIVRYVPYQWEFHLKRLSESLKACRIDFDTRRLRPLVRTLIQKNRQESGFLRIQITRGIGSEGYRPTSKTPSYTIETSASRPIDESVCQLHLSQYRRPAPNHLPVGKLTHGMASTLALLEASDHGCEDALMLSHDGYLAETACANLFWLSDETLYTPALETNCLAGSMRHTIMNDIDTYPIEQVLAKPDALENADVIFSCNVKSVVRACALKDMKKHIPATEQFVELLRTAVLEQMVRYSLEHKDTWR